MTLYGKLALIQAKILGLGKDSKSFSFKYVSGSKVLDHLKPLMIEHGILLKQEILSIENVRQDYATKNGSKSEILSKVMMKFTWVDVASGEKDENLFGANGQNDWDKGVGSALTYAERYFLLKYFHINTDEDDVDNPERETVKAIPFEARLRNATKLDDLGSVWNEIPPAEKPSYLAVKDECKDKLIAIAKPVQAETIEATPIETTPEDDEEF